MALVLHTVRDFRGACETNLGVYIPFLGQERYPARDSSLMALGVPRLESSSISKCPFFLYPFFILNSLVVLRWCLTNRVCLCRVCLAGGCSSRSPGAAWDSASIVEVVRWPMLQVSSCFSSSPPLIDAIYHVSRRSYTPHVDLRTCPPWSRSRLPQLAFLIFNLGILILLGTYY